MAKILVYRRRPNLDVGIEPELVALGYSVELLDSTGHTEDDLLTRLQQAPNEFEWIFVEESGDLAHDEDLMDAINDTGNAKLRWAFEGFTQVAVRVLVREILGKKSIN